MMITIPTTPTTVVLSITFLQQPTVSKVKMRQTHCGSVSLLLSQITVNLFQYSIITHSKLSWLKSN